MVRRLFACSLLFPLLCAAQTIWVTSRNSLYRYSTNGVLQQTIAAQYPGGYPGTEYPRTVVEAPDGSLWIYNGTFDPYLSRRLPDGTWQHFAGGLFNTVNNGSYGGVAIYGQFVFVSDNFTFSGGESRGILRWDTASNTSSRFADTVDVITLSMGLDGLLYALDGTLNVRIYDPRAMALVRTTTLAGPAFGLDLRGLTALADGTIVTVTWDGYIRRWSRAGVLLRELLLPSGTLPSASNNLINVAMLNNGSFVVGGRFGEVFVVDAGLTTFSRFTVGAVNEIAFVAASPAVTSLVTTATIAPQSGSYGQPFAFTPPPSLFSSPNSAPLTFSASGLPSGLTVNAVTGAISGTLQESGTFTIALTATDNSPLPRAATAAFVLTVPRPEIAGAYFGTGAFGTRFAALVRTDGTGVLLAHFGDLRTGYLATLFTNADGAFEARPTRFGATTGAIPIFRGRFRDKTLTLNVDGVSDTFRANQAAGTATASGYYTAVALGTATWEVHAIAGASGDVFVLLQDGATVDSAFGPLSQSAFSLLTTDGRRLEGRIDQTTGRFTGSIGAGPGVAFAGLDALQPVTRRLGNLSTRANVDSGENTLIAGFVLAGSTPRTVLVRAIGPGLQRFGVQGALARPRLRVFAGATTLIDNEGWTTATNAAAIAQASADAGAFPLATDSADSAALITLNPGSYTAAISAGQGSGVALVEVYESGPNATRLINVATRGFVGTGEGRLIVGIVVTGNAPKQLLVRAVGPSLANFGISGFLRDPELQIMSGATVIATNDNWNNDARLADAAARAGGFPLLLNNRDAAAIVTLNPGDYSLVVSGVGGTTGVGLAEVYEIAER